MAPSSSGGGLHGFFAYYRIYARSGIHAASAAALTALIGLASFVNRWFVVLAIAVYILPPVFLYLTAEGEHVPSVTDDSHDVATDADAGRWENERAPSEEAGQCGRVAESEEGPTTTADPESTVDTDVDETPDAADSDRKGTDFGWAEVDVPTDATLSDVVVDAWAGAYAVGEAGVVLARRADGWECVLDHGPAAESEPLNGVDATDDGTRVWFAGDNGAFGRYDHAESRHTDHSAPDDRTGTWADVAVTGRAGEERLYLVNGSGEVLRGTNDAGAITWDEPAKPGGGSSITSVVFDGERGYLCDTNQGVYETTDGGKSYETIGIEGANTGFTDVAAAEEVVVAGGDGSIFRHDGTNWTTLHASESALSAIDRVGEKGLAAGDGGAVYELREGDWESTETPVEDALQGVVVGEDIPDISVGTDGTIIERHR